MKPKPFLKNRILLSAALSCFCLTLAAWDIKSPTHQFIINHQLDTVPKTKDRERKVRDLDDVLNELDKNKLNVEESLKEINWEKINNEIKESLKSLNAEKMKLDIERSMKNIDFEKMNKEIQESMAKIDWKKMETEMKELQKVDFSKMQEEMKKLQVEMKNIQPEMQMQLEKLKEMDFSKLQEEMKNLQIEMQELKPQIEKELAKAKVDIDKAKDAVKEYKLFVDGLDKDGLINKKEEYTIEHKNTELIINGKKQPASVYSKYRSFLEKHKEFKLKKTADDFNIDMD